MEDNNLSPAHQSSPETAIDDFHRQGYTLLPNVLNNEQINSLRKIIDTHANRNNKKKGKHSVYKRVFEDHPEIALDIFKHENVLPLIQKLIGCCGSGRMGQDAGLATHVIHNNAYRIDPGSKGQATNWHTDDPPIFITQNGKPLPKNVTIAPLVLTCMYFLNDLNTAADGGTRVIDGSHRFGTHASETVASQYPARFVQCPAGSVLIFSAYTWHKGASISNESTSRYVFQVTYGRRLVGHKHDTIMNYQLPSKVMRALRTEEDRMLMGFLQGGAYS